MCPRGKYKLASTWAPKTHTQSLASETDNQLVIKYMIIIVFLFWGSLSQKIANNMVLWHFKKYGQTPQLQLLYNLFENVKIDSFLLEAQNNIEKFKFMKLADAVEAPEDKPLDPHVALEKVLRLDRKHTNFDFFDPARNVHFRVQYPPLLNDAPPNEHLLRQFWRHAQNYYFRNPDESQVDRLSYFSSILDQELSHELPFRPTQDFWRHLEMVFTPDYLRRQTSNLETNMDSRNWLCTLYLYNRLLQNEEGKSNKKLEKEYQELQSIRSRIELLNNNRRYSQSLRHQNQQLNKLLPKLNEESDQVSQQIRKFEHELEYGHSRTVSLFEQLEARVSREQLFKRSIYCYGKDEYEVEDNFVEGDEKILAEKLGDVDLQLRYLEYMIVCLEKKQVAESISKITKIEKSRADPKFLITFEQAMNLKRKSLTEAQLVRLNKIRQYSLFKFYNTSLKTPYSFICQNFLGYRDIYLHRNDPCKLNNKNILEEMKKSSTESPEAVKHFETFDICHHCKLLYPPEFLVKCKYTSQRMGIPIQPAPYCDSYLTQISKIETAKSQRYSTRKRNVYQSYTKMTEEYCCNRKFCRFCLRQNYDDGLDKNGLCPFCRGVCFCTRCSRNDMIVRLKSIYLLLGGQVSKFHPDRFLDIENYESADDEEKEVRKKGRPKKILKRLSTTPNKAYEHINTIRVQLEPLRLLCDLVKKRQKKKEKLLQSQQQFFLEKVSMISKDFSNILKNGRNHDSTGQQDSQQMENEKKNGHESALAAARRKKLNRMI